MTDYIVENCETAELNGTYIQVGPSFWERYDGEYYCVLTYGVEFDCMVLAVQLSDNDSAIYIDYNYGGDLPPDDPSIDWYSFITGTPSDLTVTAVSSGQNLTLTCAAGSYTLTGTNADFYRALVMACEAGSYALTGTDASLTSHRIFALGVGSYVLVGTACGLFILSPTPACRAILAEDVSAPMSDRNMRISAQSFAQQQCSRVYIIEKEQ